MTEKKVRLVVIGDGATGKSALVQAYSRTLFSAGGPNLFLQFLY